LAIFPNNPTDGIAPYAGLTKGPGGTLLGSTTSGGLHGGGTFFRINEDGSGYSILWNTSGGVSGRYPYGLPVLGSDGTIYGATYSGGNGNGDVFALTLPNTQPILAYPITNQFGTYGSPFNYTFPANTFTDADVGQALTYTASNLPPGIAFDSSSRTFSGTNTVPGAYAVTITATDNGCTQLSTNASLGLVFSAPPPTLHIELASPGTVTISWVPSTPGFLLQVNPSPDPLTWTNAPSGATNPITIPVDGRIKFLRLRR